MSEFIEIQEVAVRKDADNKRVVKDVGKFKINVDQIVSIADSDRADGCLSLLMAVGKPLLIRPHPALVNSTPTKEEQKPEKKAPKKKAAKSKEKSKFGYWD